MARTPSTMLPLGTPAPPFSLPDTNGKTVSLDDAGGARAVLVIFLCNHCPFVIHVRHEIARLAADYRERGAAVFGVNSNDAEKYPDDHPDRMKEEAERTGYTFPYLFDETQEVAKAYRAACTPDFFLFDAGLRLVYRGRLDGARPGNDVPVTGADLRAALDALLRGDPVSDEQLPSLGCNIKWRPGNEPDYFT
ncbi:MAG: thioredoxin family protein [Candidatus Eisenbacteria bacterium]